jgi:hypothetical protein
MSVAALTLSGSCRETAIRPPGRGYRLPKRAAVKMLGCAPLRSAEASAPVVPAGRCTTPPSLPRGRGWGARIRRGVATGVAWTPILGQFSSAAPTVLKGTAESVRGAGPALGWRRSSLVEVALLPTEATLGRRPMLPVVRFAAPANRLHWFQGWPWRERCGVAAAVPPLPVPAGRWAPLALRAESTSATARAAMLCLEGDAGRSTVWSGLPRWHSGLVSWCSRGASAAPPPPLHPSYTEARLSARTRPQSTFPRAVGPALGRLTTQVVAGAKGRWPTALTPSHRPALRRAVT